MDPKTDTAFFKKAKEHGTVTKLPDMLKSFYFFVFGLNIAKLTSQKNF